MAEDKNFPSGLPESVARLVERFRANRENYMSSDYNEANVRMEFIDPLLEALGWDVQNKRGLAEPYKPVRVEDSLRIAGKARAPDYSLRIGGARKILVEAKRPGINLKRDAESARQLRRYAWSAGVPVGILTDFEEFAVYDCRGRPRVSHSAAHARIRYFTCEQYGEQWEWLQNFFSPEAIELGNLDRLVADLGERRGAESVSGAFLGQIEKFRRDLAREIAAKNRRLSERELNNVVRQTLDRIIFLRVCEDRGVEDYGKLRDAVHGGNSYEGLKGLFRAADRRYNSGLFYFRAERGRGKPDALSMKLKIGNAPLRKIADALYPPESPYDFSVIGVDILGRAYEEFLGGEIRITPARQAKVKVKPEVRKQGGIFYTPEWVVRYIIGRALRDVLPDNAPARKFRALDPACGSGSFLLGAYEFLLKWHLDKYCKNPKRHLRAGRIVRDDRGEFRLSLSERREILTSNLWGVDKDEQAVEVAKLSLMLKCLEGENAGSVGAMRDLGLRALPDLGANIRAGNSIIAPDYHAELAPDPAEILRINAFDWSREFPQIIGKEGGFDAVVGNPPYVRQETLGEGFKEYAQARYEVYDGTADLFSYFVERGMSLLKSGGRFSYIVSNKWMRARYGRPLREFLRKRQLLEIVDFGVQQVFPDATTYTCILTAGGGRPGAKFRAVKIEKLPNGGDDLAEMVESRHWKIPRASLKDSGWSLAETDASILMEKLRCESAPLINVVGEIYRGVVTGFNQAFVITDAKRKELIKRDAKSARLIKPFAAGRDVKRYAPLSGGKWLIFVPRGANIADYPAIRAHLEQYRQQLRPRPANWSGKKWQGRSSGSHKWFELQSATDYHAEFGERKIIFPDISPRPNFTLDDGGFFCGNTAYFMPLTDMALLAILNSSLAAFYFTHTCAPARGGYLRFYREYVRDFPIPCRFSGDAKLRAELGKLAESAMRETVAMGKAKDSHMREAHSRLLAELNRKIDERVFALYGLTTQEARIALG